MMSCGMDYTPRPTMFEPKGVKDGPGWSLLYSACNGSCQGTPPHGQPLKQGWRVHNCLVNIWMVGWLSFANVLFYSCVLMKLNICCHNECYSYVLKLGFRVWQLSEGLVAFTWMHQVCISFLHFWMRVFLPLLVCMLHWGAALSIVCIYTFTHLHICTLHIAEH